MTVEAAQVSLDRFTRVRGDTRLRATADGRSSVAVVAKTEPLQPAPATPYPVIVAEARTASRQAMVSYRGNRYSVPPELAAAQVVVSHPVGGEFCDIATTSGIVIARHRMAADGLGVMVRDSGHVIALDAAAMATAATGRPHRRKERIPPGPAAKAAAAQLLQLKQPSITAIETSTPSTDSTVIDLSAYERAPRTGPSNDPTPAPQDHHHDHRRGVTVSSREPLSAAALAPGRTQTRRGRRSPPSGARPGHRRGPVADRGVGASAGRGSRGFHRSAAGRPVAVRLPSHPGHTGRLRRRCARRDRPQAHRRTRDVPLPGIGDQHFAGRAPWYRKDALVGRIGKGRSTCRLQDLLHHCRRSGRTVSPCRHRGTLGHHDAVLRRPHIVGDR
ncbi:insertion sequence IS21 ATP-binding domain protein [Mycobacterium kansasii 732]|nr:insertion sequence IS21 ATP-binding domain protein [Mycobacterium kansasii 732]